jgi:hypothetical protein
MIFEHGDDYNYYRNGEFIEPYKIKEKQMKDQQFEGVDPYTRYWMNVFFTLLLGPICLVFFICLGGLFSFNFEMGDFQVNFNGWWGRAHEAA